MDARQSVWEQELYSEIDYKKKESLLHCFEGDTAFIGLSFMDDIESNHFNEKVQERIQKRRERAATYSSAPAAGVSSSGNSRNPTPERRKKKSSKEENKRSSSSWRIWKKKEKKHGKPKLDKQKIGAPEVGSFLHLQGIKQGGDGGGFQQVNNMDSVDPKIQKIMQIAGLDQQILSPRKREKLEQKVKEIEEIYGPIDLDEQQNNQRQPPLTQAKPSVPLQNKPPKSPGPPTRSGAPPPPPPPPPPMPSSDKPASTFGGKRISVKKPEGDDLMSQIQNRPQLTPAQDRKHGEPEGNKPTGESLTTVLTTVINSIRDAMSSDESESDDEFDEDSDWSDDVGR